MSICNQHVKCEVTGTQIQDRSYSGWVHQPLDSYMTTGFHTPNIEICPRFHEQVEILNCTKVRSPRERFSETSMYNQPEKM